MSGLSSSYKYEENNYTSAETMEEYSLDSEEEAYENLGEQAPMGFVELGGEIQGLENASPRMDRKRSFFPSPNSTYNTRWYTADVCMSMD